MGHACGHNLIATSALASAVGVEVVMNTYNVPGTLVVMGTPAEESGGDKRIMAKNGVWKGFDELSLSSRQRLMLRAVKSSWTNVVTNAKLAEQYRQYMLHALGLTPAQMLPLDQARVEHEQLLSSDFGSRSHIWTGIQAMFEIKATDLPHPAGFREAANTDYAHEAALRAVKSNALICLDVFINDEFTSKMKDEFKEAMKKADRR